MLVKAGLEAFMKPGTFSRTHTGGLSFLMQVAMSYMVEVSRCNFHPVRKRPGR